MAKRRWIVAAVGICLAWRWLPTPNEPEVEPPVLQLAVLKNGFALGEAMEDRHLIELDSNGARRKRWAVPLLGDFRVVGSNAGSTFAWIDAKSKTLVLAPLEADGKFGGKAAFGRDAAQLCNGASSTATGFAVAWQAANRGVWFVRGPLTPSSIPEAVPFTDAANVPEATAPKKRTCAVRSAGESIALFWPAGRGMEFDFCPSTGCQGLRSKVPLKPGEEIKDLACQENGCLGAFVAGHELRLVAFDLRGKVRWQDALGAEAGNHVHLTAAGPNAYAVSYATIWGMVIERVLAKNGSIETVVNLGTEITPPVMTWARDYLAFAYIDRGSPVTSVRYLPR